MVSALVHKQNSGLAINETVSRKTTNILPRGRNQFHIVLTFISDGCSGLADFSMA